ncbi:MAG: DNA-processing protein DprA [Candidatus Babeliales bacterium]
MKTNNIILHLSLISGVGPILLSKLLAYYSVDQLNILYALTQSDFMHTIGLTEMQAQKIVAGLADKCLLEQELTLINKYNVQWITIADLQYSHLLKEIHMPPTVLYVHGSIELCNQKNIAVVGSRKAAVYAETIIQQLIPDLVSNKWTIVSGGAVGVDTMAHRAALKANGKTISIIGSGLLNTYPASNKKLFDQIVEDGGSIVSPFPLKTCAVPSNFPARNRIIAGLSRGCLVVQAAERSGAKITAQFALQEGREVFAVPGPITDQLSKGCHQLIQQGAKLVQTSNDILAEFGEEKEYEEKAVIPAQMQITEKNIQNKEQTIEDLILKHCTKPQSVDDLIELIGQDLFSTQALLFDLQLAGKIYQDLSGLWIAQK